MRKMNKRGAEMREKRVKTGEKGARVRKICEKLTNSVSLQNILDFFKVKY